MTIWGNTAGFSVPRPDWAQEDPQKADYIRGKELVENAIGEASLQTARHTARQDNPHGVTISQIGAAAQDHTHTASDVGAVTEQQVRDLIGQALEVIEHGTY